MTAVRVLIADDHPMVVEGLAAILASYDDIAVAGTVNTGQAVLDCWAALRPDVVLMDLNMPGLSGLSATEMLLERAPDARVLILSMHDSPEYIGTALRHGACGYVLKDVPTEELHDAILRVHAGETYLCTGAEARLAPGTADGREQAVLLELAQGKSNKEVGVALDISVRTVETHRKNIRRKLGISSTAGLTRYALEHGVLQGTGH